MTKNLIIKHKNALDIDRKVERVLEDLGNPEPPLDLHVVREMLRLDLGYYTANDPGVLQEVVSKLVMSGKQVLARPSRILDAVRKWDLRALYIPDRKQILLDKDQPQLKHRWHEAHEIGHSLLPWHAGAMMGDNEHTLIPSCHAELEAEANLAAGRLLFLRERFAEECLSKAPSFETLKELKKTYGNTHTTTFWRGVETWGRELPVIGLITEHPNVLHRSADFDPDNPCKHFIQSPAFAMQFSSVQAIDVFSQVSAYCKRNKSGPLGESDVILIDDNGDHHIFHFESFSFHYQTLTLGIYQAPRNRLIGIA